MRDVSEEVVKLLCSFLELNDLVLRSVKNLLPLIDDDLRESADEEYHDNVEDRTRDDECIKLLMCKNHRDNLECHRAVVSKLA